MHDVFAKYLLPIVHHILVVQQWSLNTFKYTY